MARKLFFAKVNDTSRMRGYGVPGLVGSIVTVFKETDHIVFLSETMLCKNGYHKDCGGNVTADYTLLHDRGD